MIEREVGVSEQELAATSFPQKVVRILESLILWHGRPECLRTDNGSEFTSMAPTAPEVLGA